MFKTPVSTIRDVAELTEASPNLIARILGDMRDPSKIEKLESELQVYDVRLREVEKKLSIAAKPKAADPKSVAPKPPPKAPVVIRPKVPEINVSIEAWKRADKTTRAALARKKDF